MAKSTTTPRPSSSGSGTPQTGFAGNMAYPSLSIAARPQPPSLAGRAERQAHPLQHLPGRRAGGRQRRSRTVEMMEKYLRRKGYLTDFTGKHWKIRLAAVSALHPPGHPGRAVDAGEHQAQPGRTGHSFGNKRPTVNFAPELPRNCGSMCRFQPRPTFTGCSSIGNVSAWHPTQKDDLSTHQSVSEEELRKLDEITAQVDYLAKTRIETLDDLLSARETLQSEIDTLTDQRTKLQNKMRRASPAEKE